MKDLWHLFPNLIKKSINFSTGKIHPSLPVDVVFKKKKKQLLVAYLTTPFAPDGSAVAFKTQMAPSTLQF